MQIRFLWKGASQF